MSWKGLRCIPVVKIKSPHPFFRFFLYICESYILLSHVILLFMWWHNLNGGNMIFRIVMVLGVIIVGPIHFFFNWSTVDLQFCVSFRFIEKRFSYTCICVCVCVCNLFQILFHFFKKLRPRGQIPCLLVQGHMANWWLRESRTQVSWLLGLSFICFLHVLSQD